MKTQQIIQGDKRNGTREWAAYSSSRKKRTLSMKKHRKIVGLRPCVVELWPVLALSSPCTIVMIHFFLFLR